MSEEQHTWEQLSWGGVTILSLIFGFIGAALGVSYTQQMTKKEAVAALGAGLACAALLPQLAASLIGMAFAPSVSNGLAFVCGILGMFIVPGLLTIGKKFRENPWWVIDWVRGKSQ